MTLYSDQTNFKPSHFYIDRVLSWKHC